MRITKAQLKEYIGRMVEITLFDNTVYCGVLGFTPEFSEKYGWRKPNYFTVSNLDFKVSHLKSIQIKR